ncbi:hypothetical protein [Streptomyces sp. NPDC001787]|uniref:nSTAND1 domain-containing NTPase n=1 Tax=Streptomyces sp. NPDC001787 TaxID=3154523 RepID=UPI00332F055B
MCRQVRHCHESESSYPGQRVRASRSRGRTPLPRDSRGRGGVRIRVGGRRLGILGSGGPRGAGTINGPLTKVPLRGITAVVGASGSGKSSLLRASLVPRLWHLCGYAFPATMTRRRQGHRADRRFLARPDSARTSCGQMASGAPQKGGLTHVGRGLGRYRRGGPCRRP